MTKLSFEGKPLGRGHYESADVRSPLGQCAFQPFVLLRPGVEAIIEGLRLAHVEGEPSLRDKSADDVDA